MKKTIIYLIFLLGVLMCEGDFVWEEPVWVNQAGMIHNIYNYEMEPMTVAFSDGFYLVWVESEASQGQLFAQKLSNTGEELWEQPVQLCEAEEFPRLASVICDQEDNLITAFKQNNAVDVLRIIKNNVNGEPVIDIEINESETYVYEAEMKMGLNNNFYVHTSKMDLTGMMIDEFYQYDSEGNIVPEWNEGLLVSSHGVIGWEIDNAGDLVIMYRSQSAKLELQKYNSEAQPVFPEPIEISSNFWEWIGDNLYFNIIPTGQYLCVWPESTILLNTDGSQEWEIGTNEEYNLYTQMVLTGENCFYELNNNNEVYQFNYNGEHNWNEQIISSEVELEVIELKSGDGVRVVSRSGLGYGAWNTYRLIDYNSSGVMESPEEGWYNCETFGSYYHPVFLKGSGNVFVWAALNHDEDFNQELSLITVSEAGQILTGDEAVIVRTGLEQKYKPLAVYVNDEIESILLQDISRPSTTGNGGSRIILQQLNRGGEPVSEPSGITLLSGVNKFLKQRDNLVLCSSRVGDELRIHLIDLESGNLVWGEEGCVISNNDVSSIDGDIIDDLVIIYWKEGAGFRYQGIIDGEEIWNPGGVLMPFSDVLYVDLAVYGNYVLNHVNGHYRISYITEQGEIGWHNNNYYYANFARPAMVTDEGLLFLYCEGGVNSDEIYCQLLDSDNNPLFGQNGLYIGNFDPDNVWGTFSLEGSAGVVIYNSESGEPAEYMGFDLNGEIIQPLCELAGSENSDIIRINSIQNGFVILSTQPTDAYNDLILSCYDHEGNLTEPGNYPMICYADYAHYDALVCMNYNNTFYYSWQTAVNSYDLHLNLSGNDVMLQGWDIPAVNTTEDEIIESEALRIYPNPFNPETRISYTVPVTGPVNISVYNIKGQKVEDILETEMEAGEYGLVWNAEKHNSGVYFLRILTGTGSQITKAVLLK